MSSGRADDAPAVIGTVVPVSFADGANMGFNWGKKDFRIVPYGAFWSDMVYASSRTNPGAFTFFVESEETQGEDALTIDARRSRFGLNVFGPNIPLDGGMKTGGQVEIDFQGEFVIENRAEILLRQLYWEAKNDRQRFLVGQHWDVISPLLPRTLNYSVGWLGGNIGYRRAQIRYERYGCCTPDLAWTLQASVNQDIIPDFPTDPGVQRESSNWPVIEARAALALNPRAGARATVIGVSGHIGETGFDFLTTGPPPLNLPPVDDARFETWSYNIDLSVPLTKRLHLQAELFRGRNLSPFLGGIGQGVCPCTRTPIDSQGGWFDVQFKCCDYLSTTAGCGVDDPDDDDLLLGRNYNRFIFANVLLDVTSAISTGIEVTYWKTLWDDSRVGMVPADELGPRTPGKAVTVDWMFKYAF